MKVCAPISKIAILAKTWNWSGLKIQHVSEAEAFYSLQPKFILDFHMLLRETQAIKPYDAELIARLNAILLWAAHKFVFIVLSFSGRWIGCSFPFAWSISADPYCENRNRWLHKPFPSKVNSARWSCLFGPIWSCMSPISYCKSVGRSLRGICSSRALAPLCAASNCLDS